MNVKQGDLAIQIRAFVTENVGSIVTVGPLLYVDPEIGPVWNVTFNRPAWVYSDELGQVVPIAAGVVAHVRDEWLRPVSGLPVEEYDRVMEQEPA